LLTSYLLSTITMASATGISCDINERIENVEIVVESTNDVTLSQEVDKKNNKNQRKTGVKKIINGGIHKINKVISSFSLQYSQPIYYN